MSEQQVATVVAADLRRAERSIETATRDIAQLVVSMAETSAKLDVSPAFALPAMLAANEAITAMINGQRRIVLRVHPTLEKAARTLQMPESAWGGGTPKPSAAAIEYSDVRQTIEA